MAEAADRKSFDLYQNQFNPDEPGLNNRKKSTKLATTKNVFFSLLLFLIALWFFEQLVSINTSENAYTSAESFKFDPVNDSKNQSNKSIDFQLGQAQKLHQQGQFIAAQDILQQILSSDKDHLQARLMLASSLIDQDQKRDAIKLYTEGFKNAPKEPHIAQPLAKLLEEEGKIDLAIKVLLYAVPSNMSDPAYYASIAALQQKLGRHKDVIKIYQTILQKRPENRQWWLDLGISLLAETRKVEAREAFEKALLDKTLSPALASFAHQRIKELKRS